MVILVLNLVTQANGLRVLLLSPTFRKLQDNFVSVWKYAVPPELYKYRKADGVIELINGSTILLRSRHIDNPSRGEDDARGLSVDVVIDDEAAEGFNHRQFTTASGCLRSTPSKFKAYIMTTTPRVNDLWELAQGPGITLLKTSCYDSPYCTPEWIEDLAEHMSEAEFDREVNANWTHLAGRIWDNFSFAAFPDGNMSSQKHDFRQPYYLAMDIGSANASYLVFQRVDSKWLLTAEYHPRQAADSSVATMLRRIGEEMKGAPCRVIAGNDLRTRASTDNRTPIYFVRNVFGSIPVQMPDGVQRDKQVQHTQCLGLIKSMSGGRRLLVSKDLHSHDPEGRGFLETMRIYAWEEKNRGGSTFLPKGGNAKYRFEHCSDAFMYFTVCVANPPRFIKTNNLPG